ncbi:MAG: hypothetical protein H0T51_08225 [Pirellulales bacterium]|nr:hypothetical protein [Pirellulales bacterium]
MIRVVGAALVVMAPCAHAARGADEYKQPPIEYSKSTPDNRIARLQAALDRGEVELPRESRLGYLRALLERLEIPPESQMLVFSKTSMQRDRISPRTPRAIYFDDDVYVGYCHAGDDVEMAVADPQLGAVFYTLDQTNHDAPKLIRETHRCLQCHGATQTDDTPGFLVRSLFVGGSGLPILSEGSHRVDHTTPIEDRWGGWYITGASGAQDHLGNLVIRDRDAPKPWKNEAANPADLRDRLRVDNYPTPHSDVVALLVFEHQTHVHNLIIKASFAARQALHYEAGLIKALGEPEGNRLESTTRRIENAGEKLVEGLLFANEAPIKEPIAGSSSFAEAFTQRGPRDAQGRSLRNLQLSSRLFKHPCSYLIYSPTFDALPSVMQDYVARRLREILAGENDESYSHLSAADRQAISEILRETKPDLFGSVER